MDKKYKNPEVRFKGFTDDWEPGFLGSLFGLENGFAFKSEFFQDDKSNLIVLTPGNVNIGGGFQNGKGQYYNPKGEFSRRFVFNPDDIFVTMTDLTPTGQTLGFPALVPYDGIIYLHNQRLGKLVSYNCDRKFLFHLLCNPNIQRQIVKTSSGTTVKHTSPNKILNTKTSFPKPTEQKQIGSFFQNLDNLITLHQKKYDKVVILKKAMLVKMFPKNGALVPEIRFKGYTEDWVEKRLGDFAQIKRGLTYSPIDVANKGIKVLRSSNILEDTFVQKEDDVYVNDKAINIEFAQENDILITSANGSSRLVGKHAILKNLKIKAVHGGFMLIARTKYPYFLHASMSSPWYRKFINMNMAGGNGAIGNLKASDLEQHDILTPHEDEQQKIGFYFHNLDNQIALHKTQLDKLSTIKKACFSKMFVAQD